MIPPSLGVRPLSYLLSFVGSIACVLIAILDRGIGVGIGRFMALMVASCASARIVESCSMVIVILAAVG